MRKNLWQYLAIVVLSLSLLLLLLTGLMLWWVLPPGSHRATVWGMTRHEWGDVHFWASVVMLLGVAGHLVQNWGWFCTVSVRLIHRKAAAPSRAKRHIAGVALVAAVVLGCMGFVMLAEQAKVPDTWRDGGRGHRQAYQEDRPREQTRQDDDGGDPGRSDDGERGHESHRNPDGVGRGQGGQGRGLHRRSQREQDP